MYFTNSEKQAIYRLLMDMSLIDNDIDSTEVILTMAIVEKLNISDYDRDRATAITIDYALETVANMTSTEKDFVCSALGTMIAIDGEVNPKEMLLWGIITARCGFPEMNLMEAGAKLQQYLQNI